MASRSLLPMVAYLRHTERPLAEALISRGQPVHCNPLAPWMETSQRKSSRCARTLGSQKATRAAHAPSAFHGIWRETTIRTAEGTKRPICRAAPTRDAAPDRRRCPFASQLPSLSADPHDARLCWLGCVLDEGRGGTGVNTRLNANPENE